ncbi:TonB-dependent receptor-like protein [Novosphingobium sp. Rr 2-17]|uniref:TonB-dependent receptor plug domain-containing protein n=1 Tax=Novosphingobium sp. Rr 2-17 TaxID=555793 RepID=UPI00026998EA|nr:TonB-dependent receptor [Novosphingobium sp. Rr 2-17]EIZ77404.1 TonB-dependent receptor-like protein [Novosphingobium sp. Rr 2-17]
MYSAAYKSTAEGDQRPHARLCWSKKAARALLLASAPSLFCISPTMAQEAPTPDEDDQETPSGDITVTGSRILRNGYNAPTPVAILSEADIAAQAPANISDFVNQMPAIAGSGTSGTASGGLSNAGAGINSVGLRGLGVGRTLVLVDGQRSVASTVGGTVDINTIPQDLVKRVEVVTGGASAAYGSDAVGGVVNFILDTEYTGVKLSSDVGISTYGDGLNYRFAGTAGFTALDGRLHSLTSVSYFDQKKVEGIDRDWNNSGYFQITNPDYKAGNGEPERYVGSGIGPSTYTSGGLITSGPLKGTYFLGEGETGQLNYGDVSGSWMIGGDWEKTLEGHEGTNTLVPRDQRISVFQRLGYELTDEIEVFVQGSYNRSYSESSYQQTPSTGVSIKSDNAYLLSQYPDVAAAMQAQGLSSITIGTSNAGYPVPGSENTRQVFRFVGGAKGKLDLFDKPFSWNAYYQKGVTKTREKLVNTWNNARMSLAQDAVYASDGSIVCRSTLTDPDNGCVPIDRLGTDGPSQEALDYIYGDQPVRHQTIKQDVGAATISGDAFALPAGNIAFATGVEWRREQINGSVDEQFNSGWLYGNYRVNQGKYDVYEGFLELDIPVFDGFDLNAAARGTHYSTSGWVGTWKVGATWQAIDSVRLRGNLSHDIRAPNLEELYAAGTARTNSVIIPSDADAPVTGSQQFVQNSFGNSDLKPEVADGWTAGVVLTPSFLPGFTLSFDYYAIKIKDAIGTLTAQQTVDLCYEQKVTSYCANIHYDSSGALSTIDLSPINFASQKTKGFDIEGSYSHEVGPGKLRLNAQITHYIENIVDDGVSYPIDYAGVLTNTTYATPNWVYRLSAFYDVGPVTLNVVARGFTDGVYGNDWIECTSDCPASTPQYRTINDNDIKGATYYDASIAFKFPVMAREGSLTFVVNNILNKDPVLVGNGPDGNNVPAYAQTNRSRYDVVGRTFRLSMKVEL